ncbi:hypothetical protein Tco_0843275, partial [Tanacetum coccineum]
DEDAMDKEVAGKVKDHKRKHDSDDDEDDDDDEGPLARSNQGRLTKRRRSDSAASGSAKPPPKADDQTLTSTGWQITDTRDAGADSDMEDTDNAHIPKNQRITGQIHTQQRIMFPRRTSFKERRMILGHSSNGSADEQERRSSAKLIYKMDECHKLLTNKVDLVNPEGYQILRNIYEPLSLGGPPGEVTIQPQFFFNKNLDYLLTGDKERKIALSISKLKATRYLDFGLEELVLSLCTKIRGLQLTGESNLRRAEYKEYRSRKMDFNNLHPNIFEIYSYSIFKEKLNICPNRQNSLSQGSQHVYRNMDTYPILLSFTHCGNKSILRVLRIILVILPEHPSETKVFHNEDGNPARANIKQALGSYERPHKGVKASANSDIVYFFTSAQDGDPLQDDVRLCLGDDLKKAQDHNQRQVKDESKDHYPKCTRYQMSTS